MIVYLELILKISAMPAPLSSCRLANITASSLKLTCERPEPSSAASTTLYRAEVNSSNDLYKSFLIYNVQKNCVEKFEIQSLLDLTDAQNVSCLGLCGRDICPKSSA